MFSGLKQGSIYQRHIICFSTINAYILIMLLCVFEHQLDPSPVTVKSSALDDGVPRLAERYVWSCLCSVLARNDRAQVSVSLAVCRFRNFF